MAKVKQSKSEFINHLNESLEFIKLSCSAFDSGYVGEAKRLAVTIRLLLHDTKNSKSLLGLLGWKGGFTFLDTAYDFNPRNIAGHHGLVGVKIDKGGSGYFALHSDSTNNINKRFVRFPDWWNKIVICDLKKNKFNRRELVLALANKDGGAHVDPKIDQDYADLTRNNSMGWVEIEGASRTPLTSIESYSVRQIAYELLESIEKLKLKHSAE